MSAWSLYDVSIGLMCFVNFSIGHVHLDICSVEVETWPFAAVYVSSCGASDNIHNILMVWLVTKISTTAVIPVSFVWRQCTLAKSLLAFNISSTMAQQLNLKSLPYWQVKPCFKSYTLLSVVDCFYWLMLCDTHHSHNTYTVQKVQLRLWDNFLMHVQSECVVCYIFIFGCVHVVICVHFTAVGSPEATRWLAMWRGAACRQHERDVECCEEDKGRGLQCPPQCQQCHQEEGSPGLIPQHGFFPLSTGHWRARSLLPRCFKGMYHMTYYILTALHSWLLN